MNSILKSFDVLPGNVQCPLEYSTFLPVYGVRCSFWSQSVKEQLEDSLQAKGKPEIVSPALTVSLKKAETLSEKHQDFIWFFSIIMIWIRFFEVKRHETSVELAQQTINNCKSLKPQERKKKNL